MRIPRNLCIVWSKANRLVLSHGLDSMNMSNRIIRAHRATQQVNSRILVRTHSTVKVPDSKQPSMSLKQIWKQHRTSTSVTVISLSNDSDRDREREESSSTARRTLDCALHQCHQWQVLTELGGPVIGRPHGRLERCFLTCT